MLIIRSVPRVRLSAPEAAVYWWLIAHTSSPADVVYQQLRMLGGRAVFDQAVFGLREKGVLA